MLLGGTTHVHILVIINFIVQPSKKYFKIHLRFLSLHLEPPSLVKLSTITIMCTRYQSRKAVPCPHDPAANNKTEKIIEKNLAKTGMILNY